MKRNILVSVLVSSAFLILPAFALAAGITVGNAAINRSTVDTYSNFTIIDTNVPVSGNGWITTFSYYAANTNPFEFVLVDSSNVVQWVSPTITPPGVGTQTYNINAPVQAGWNLGAHFDSTGTIPFDSTGLPATYTPNNNGKPVVGQTLAVEGTSNRTYSWNGNGSDAASCSTQTLESSTGTQFAGYTLTDPIASSLATLFTLGAHGAAVQTAPDGFPGAWNATSANTNLSGAIWVSDMAASPTSGGTGDQNGSVNVWRLFTQAITLPAGATINSAVLHFTADNSVTAFLDHASVGTATDYNTVVDSSLAGLTGGNHELEFVVKNDAYGGTTNPTGLIYRTDINYCVPATPPATECPAAPSIAAAYLPTIGAKAGSTIYKNVISLVAHQMGPQTDFNGKNACASDYASTVQTYTQNLVNSPLSKK